MRKTRRGSRFPSLLPKKLLRDRDQVLDLIRGAQELAKGLDDANLRGEIDQLAASALKPFLFVVVGEVKSGKSSLINALLETPVCAVDTAPCTTRVQEINFGDEEQRIEVSQFEERLQLPHDILRHIAIVDTPGTNSIIRQHQVVTENYIPQSDLVLFVFFAKNPYTGSAWDFLRYIKHEWHRNTLFVLQQADLLEAGELDRTLALVKQQLSNEEFAEPVVFAVSALTGEGLDVLREYLRTEIVTGRQFNKSISLTDNVLRFLSRLEGALRDHECLIEHDETVLGDFRQLLVGLGPEADQEYAAIAARAEHHGEHARRDLAERLSGIGGALTRGSHEAGERPGPALSGRRLAQMAQTLAQSVALRDVLSGGGETPLRVAERFSRLQNELNRCLFDAQLRRIELYRKLKRRAQEQLDTLASEPSCLSASPNDSLARRRQQTLTKARHAIDELGELGSDDAAAQLPVPRRIDRRPTAYRLAQAGVGLGCLVIGYQLDNLLTGLVLGLVGYLGAGFGLAAQSRKRIGRQARIALERTLADFDRRLRGTLLTQPGKLQAVVQGTVGRCERNVAQRRARTDELLSSVHALREQVKEFQGQARREAPQPRQ